MEYIERRDEPEGSVAAGRSVSHDDDDAPMLCMIHVCIHNVCMLR